MISLIFMTEEHDLEKLIVAGSELGIVLAFIALVNTRAPERWNLTTMSIDDLQTPNLEGPWNRSEKLTVSLESRMLALTSDNPDAERRQSKD